MNKKIIAAIIMPVMMAGCAGGWAGQGYSPVVDAYGSPGKNPAAYSSDMAYCQSAGAQRNQLPDTAAGAGLGALGGAATGALVGLADGDNIGAASLFGAGFGALAGGALSAYQSNENRQNIVMSCMTSRGWTVLGR